jgi:hypothetical protein
MRLSPSSMRLSLRMLSVGPDAKRCPITLCDADPSACETQVTPVEALSLILLMAVPCFLAWLGPIVLAPCVPLNQRRDADDPTGSSGAQGLRASVWSYRVNIDPPMFLCGLACLPFDCGASGLLGVVLAMGMGVFVVFFGLLFGRGHLDSYPCDGGLGSCRTISCICGNMITEGCACGWHVGRTGAMKTDHLRGDSARPP